MASVRVVSWAIAASVGTVAAVHAAELQPTTVKAYDRYVTITEAQIEARLESDIPFLWVDRLPDSARAEAYDRLRAGELVIERLETRDTGTGAKIKIPGGKIHHWIATVVISGATLERTLETIQDYDRWDELYVTNVRRSRLLHRDGSRFKVYFQLFLRTVVTVVLNTEYDIEYMRLGDHCAYARTVSTRIVEVEHPDTTQEREKPEGQDRGFLWRMRNYCLFEERAGDMYVQCESVSLSRGIPLLLRVFVRPFVDGIPKSVLTEFLEATRTHLTSGQASRLVSPEGGT